MAGKARRVSEMAATLDEHCLYTVFSYLDNHSLGRVRRVCVTWRDVADRRSVNLWKGRMFLVDRVLGHGLPRGVSFVSFDPDSLYHTSYDPSLFSVWDSEYPFVKYFCSFRPLPITVAMNVLSHFPNLEDVSVHLSAIGPPSFVSDVPFGKLPLRKTVTQMFIQMGAGVMFESTFNVSDMTIMPNLRDLYITGNVSPMSMVQSIYIVACCPQLRSFHCDSVIDLNGDVIYPDSSGYDLVKNIRAAMYKFGCRYPQEF